MTVNGDDVLLIVSKNWCIGECQRRRCIVDGLQELMYWWQLTEMMYCWLLARTDVLLKVIGDEELLMVYKNWGIDES